MGTRLELQSKLEEMLGCRHVYFQPPESVKMEYPAIVYSRSSVKKVSANNTGYLLMNKYSVVMKLGSSVLAYSVNRKMRVAKLHG